MKIVATLPRATNVLPNFRVKTWRNFRCSHPRFQFWFKGSLVLSHPLAGLVNPALEWCFFNECPACSELECLSPNRCQAESWLRVIGVSSPALQQRLIFQSLARI